MTEFPYFSTRGFSARTLAVAIVALVVLFSTAWTAFAAEETVAEDQPPAAENASFDPFEQTVDQLQVAMGNGRLTAVELLDYHLQRIAHFDQRGPTLNAVAAVNPEARRIAQALDREREQRGPRGPLHGIPVIVKDNFETRGMQTTAGSAALAGFAPQRDAFQVERLRAAGAVIIGKANMHEFGYGITSMGSGFGAVRNPYDPSRNPGGSSGGSAAAIAANFASAALGTDTCGSIRIPAAHNNLVGLRGTQGLSSRRGILPLSHTQDVAGPMARTVTDVAHLLDATVGFDRQDLQTADSFGHIPDSYANELHPGALRGANVGLLEDLLLVDPEDAEVAAIVGAAAEAMQAMGANIRRIRIPGLDGLLSTRVDGFFVLVHDFKTDINAYLLANPEAPVKSLAEILAGGAYHESIDSSLRLSAAMDDGSRADYLAELDHRRRLRQRTLAVMAQHGLDVLAYPSIRRKAEPIGLDQPGSNCRLSANSGLPALTLPAGFTDDGLPVGIELLGAPWSEPMLLSLGFSFEQGTRHRRPPVLTVPEPPVEANPTEENGDG
ncbi:MAG: amidase family protein [Gammaproteobacteria bacterium]|nr:amidase family protein [Gammaproteobacteria bacterium]